MLANLKAQRASRVPKKLGGADQYCTTFSEYFTYILGTSIGTLQLSWPTKLAPMSVRARVFLEPARELEERKGQGKEIGLAGPCSGDRTGVSRRTDRVRWITVSLGGLCS